MLKFFIPLLFLPLLADTLWQDIPENKTLKLTLDEAVAFCRDGWRLPSIEELLTIVDTTKYDPASKIAFENIEPESYWSATSNAANASYAWLVHFYAGNYETATQSNHYNVRCIKSDAQIALPPKLQWKTTTQKHSWNDALKTCKSPWRLPTIEELRSRVDFGAPSTDPNRYWSSTSYAVNGDYAWDVNFATGNGYFDPKSELNFVECVRGEKKR
jgi:hypothetical protein